LLGLLANDVSWRCVADGERSRCFGFGSAPAGDSGDS
jgi:hypothetical protein